MRTYPFVDKIASLYIFICLFGQYQNYQMMICLTLFAYTKQTIYNYNTKIPFLMSNVITEKESNYGKISLTSTSTIISPLKPKENQLNQVALEPLNSKQPHMTRPFTFKSENREPAASANSTQKPRIVLRKGQNCKCDSKHKHFQEKQKIYYVSLVSQKQKNRKSRQFLRVSIDLDKIRAQEKKQSLSTLVADHNQLELHNREQMKFSTWIQSQENQKMPVGNLRLKVDQESGKQMNITSQGKEADSNFFRKRNTSKLIRQTLVKKKSNSQSTFRPSSLDSIVRPDEPLIASKNEQITHKQSNSHSPHQSHAALSEEQTLKALFKKLTKNNLPYQNWINYLNINCKQLTMDELHFVGILLQKIQPKYLSAMSYLGFKYKITQTCQKELQELVRFQKLNQ